MSIITSRSVTGVTRRFLFLNIALGIVLWLGGISSGDLAAAADLRVMKTGLGGGTISVGGSPCGLTCDVPISGDITLIATAAGDSTFAGWDGDCSGTGTCLVPMTTTNRAVRAKFDLSPSIPLLSVAFTDPAPPGTMYPANGDFTPERIAAYLRANPNVNSPARFIAALPDPYKQNWILMSRSESLQTGTAQSPRILLPSTDARFVFTVGMTAHSSYPGSHPNAIEFMQWDGDPAQKTFRFHEIVVDTVPAVPGNPAFLTRSRGVSVDDPKCFSCHSTRNVINLDRSVSPPVPGPTNGTDGIPPGSVRVKSKPNWDAYDSWGGMTPFNRDRIYQGSVEAAVFRKTFNLWTWRTNDAIKMIIEQLELQPPGVPSSPAADHRITRQIGGPNDGHVNFGFDSAPPVFTEPVPTGTEPPITASYSFDGTTGSGTSVTRGGSFVTLHYSLNAMSDEGRGVRFFDTLGGLGGTLNQERIADELIHHHFATGSVPIDVRPIALAITTGCVTNPDTLAAPASAVRDFFDARNGMNYAGVEADTRSRRQGLPLRKADIEKRTMDRAGDPYLLLTAPANGVLQEFGAATSAGSYTALDLGRLRQEVFRRPTTGFGGDSTIMGGFYVDRERYDAFNENTIISLSRYFLEPLGVSVDKWSMGVRGRSRTYTFADVFDTYISTINGVVGTNYLGHTAGTGDCARLIGDITNSTGIWSRLPLAADLPKFTDIQRIFNKSCVECHGGLRYPPYQNYGAFFDLSENETPDTTATPPATRMTRSHGIASAFATDILNRITSTNEDCSPPGTTITGTRSMPCGGPRLSQVDIETIRRWIVGGRSYTEGDPHIRTIDGVNYDFQSAGEFVLLRGEGLEIQTRQTAVETELPLGPNPYTGLSSCVSVNTAVAVRIGPHRITYQPDPEGLQLRIDGTPVQMTAQGILLPSGGRIIGTTASGGLQIEAPGGTVVVITPGWWNNYRMWYLNIDARHVRATEGVMGAIAPGSWLPALPNGSFLKPTTDPHQRYVDLYETFADAWRVTEATSLFRYTDQLPMKTFTVRSWPGENRQSCSLPPVDIEGQGPPRKPPVKPLKLEVAQQHCRDIDAEDRRANCVQDVMATGEPGFAKTYLATEKIERNKVPTAPRLLSPENEQTGLPRTVVFMWKQATDPDGDLVAYRHCVWSVEKMPTEADCTKAVPHQMAGQDGDTRYAGLAWLGGSGLLVGLLTPWMRKRRGLLSLTALALLTGVLLSSCSLLEMTTGTDAVTKKVSGLDSGKSYFWKVVADDGNGGSTESETWRFTTK